MAKGISLLAACWTSAGNVRPGQTADESPHSLEERVAAVAAAGYAGIGIELADLRPLREERRLGELRARVADAGMAEIQIEFIDDWFVGGARRHASDQRREELLDIAEKLGADHIKVGGGQADDAVHLDDVREEFDVLAKQAEERGTRIALEPGAWSFLANLDVAASVVMSAQSPAGGLLLDIWHLQRTGFDYDRLPLIVPTGRLFAVELNDGKREPVGDLLSDTLDRRIYCGDGDFGVVRFIRAVDSIGYQGSWGVEHMSVAHRALPIEEALRAAASAARLCLAEALG